MKNDVYKDWRILVPIGAMIISIICIVKYSHSNEGSKTNDKAHNIKKNTVVDSGNYVSYNGFKENLRPDVKTYKYVSGLNDSKKANGKAKIEYKELPNNTTSLICGTYVDGNEVYNMGRPAAKNLATFYKHGDWKMHDDNDNLYAMGL